MKPLLIALAGLTLLAAHQLWIAPALEQAATAGLGDDARLAIELRCGEPEREGARDCRAELERLYASGALDPDRTLRVYCESVRSAPWGRDHARPPRVCVERYGGW